VAIAVAVTSHEPRAGFPLTLEITTARLPKRSGARIGQIRTLSVERLGKRLGRIAPEELDGIVERAQRDHRGLTFVCQDVVRGGARERRSMRTSCFANSTDIVDRRCCGILDSVVHVTYDSDPLKSLHRVAVESAIDATSNGDLIRWAENVLAMGHELSFDPDVLELASLPIGNVRKEEQASLLLNRVVERWVPGFQISSKESEAYARECFLRMCQRLLDGDIRPYELCRMVDPIEQAFQFPDWLADFYSHCDWIEPSSEPVDCRHLYEYAEQYLRNG
jgi:hypothetical protein